MKKLTLKMARWIGLPGAAILVFCAGSTWLLIGCSTTPATESVAAASGKSGAELWADNCVRCHNIRSPGSYSPAQWEVVMMHMRVRANLTPEEHKKILEFLKAGS